MSISRIQKVVKKSFVSNILGIPNIETLLDVYSYVDDSYFELDFKVLKIKCKGVVGGDCGKRCSLKLKESRPLRKFAKIKAFRELSDWISDRNSQSRLRNKPMTIERLESIWNQI